MGMIDNGIVILERGMRTPQIRSFQEELKKTGNYEYHGIHEFNDFPLINQDQESNRLFKAITFFGNTALSQCSFAHDKEIITKYIEKCNQINIDISYMFVQSDYEKEKWVHPLPKMKFIGYEVCEIPLDACAIYDLFMCEQYKKFLPELNKNGLFKTESDALAFKQEYERDLAAGIVGDGEVDLYVCKIYEVSEEELLKVL